LGTYNLLFLKIRSVYANPVPIKFYVDPSGHDDLVLYSAEMEYVEKQLRDLTVGTAEYNAMAEWKKELTKTMAGCFVLEGAAVEGLTTAEKEALATKLVDQTITMDTIALMGVENT
jgi:hypothetical protein